MAKRKQQIQDAIPDAIRNTIKEHLRSGTRHAEKGWRNAPTSEDVLTGDLGSSLRTDWSEQVEAEGYLWRWRVQYRKMGAGNQHSSEEKPTGADGIFQVEVKRYNVGVTPVDGNLFHLQNIEEESTFTKGVLFQAKRHDATNSKMLFDEVSKIEELTPGDGIYIEFGPKEYRSTLAKRVVAVKGLVAQVPSEDFQRVESILTDYFMECRVGVEGMYVDLDSEPQTLTFPKSRQAVKDLGVRLSHALNVKVVGFKMVPFVKG